MARLDPYPDWSLYAKACHFVRPLYRSDLSFLLSQLTVYFRAFIEVVTSPCAIYSDLNATDNCQDGLSPTSPVILLAALRLCCTMFINDFGNT